MREAMNDALTKVDVPLMERYETTCVSCGWYRHFFGTAQEARESAEKMGWEFRTVFCVMREGMSMPVSGKFEDAYCPHCRLLIKEKP